VSGPGRPTTLWLRRSAPLLFSAILLISAFSVRPTLQWNLHLWHRLNELHRVAPQSALDLRYKALAAYLPSGDPVCLRQTPASAADPTAAALIRVQYALAPRLVLEGHTCEYTIIVGPGALASPLGSARLVHAFDDELLLIRQATP
jgi:hypothetical protein